MKCSGMSVHSSGQQLHVPCSACDIVDMRAEVYALDIDSVGRDNDNVRDDKIEDVRVSVDEYAEL